MVLTPRIFLYCFVQPRQCRAILSVQDINQSAVHHKLVTGVDGIGIKIWHCGDLAADKAELIGQVLCHLRVGLAVRLNGVFVPGPADG